MSLLCRFGIHNYDTVTLWEARTQYARLKLDGDRCVRCGTIRPEHKAEGDRLCAFRRNFLTAR